MDILNALVLSFVIHSCFATVVNMHMDCLYYLYILSHRHFQSSSHESVSFELYSNSHVLCCKAKDK